jgi:hypothetical protein
MAVPLLTLGSPRSGRSLTVILLTLAAAAFIVPHVGAFRGRSFTGDD